MINIPYSKLSIRHISEPEIGNKVYYICSDETGDIDPCIVESGQYLSNGRLSNYWEWINLRTGKREHGYGGFLELFENQ